MKEEGRGEMGQATPLRGREGTGRGSELLETTLDPVAGCSFERGEEGGVEKGRSVDSTFRAGRDSFSRQTRDLAPPFAEYGEWTDPQRPERLLLCLSWDRMSSLSYFAPESSRSREANHSSLQDRTHPRLPPFQHPQTGLSISSRNCQNPGSRIVVLAARAFYRPRLLDDDP